MSWVFLASPQDDLALRERAVELLGDQAQDFLGEDQLRAATRQHGADLATLMALECFHRQRENATFLARLAAYPKRCGVAPASAPPIAIIPTMYHQERPELGGDGGLIAGIAQRFGLRVDTIAVGSLAGVETNAGIIRRHLATWQRPGWIFSLSKGTSDLKRALLVEPQLAERVRGWITIAGMPGGTPLTEGKTGRPLSHALMQGWLLLRGGERDLLAEMGRDHPISRAGLVLPPHLEVVNVVPMLLSFQARKPADRSWRYLSTMGPNDGYVLLQDALIQAGFVIPILGSDHYLRTPELTAVIYRLMWHILGAAP